MIKTVPAFRELQCSIGTQTHKKGKIKVLKIYRGHSIKYILVILGNNIRSGKFHLERKLGKTSEIK